MAVALLPIMLPAPLDDLAGVGGAVVELYVRDGLVYADLRIPAPQSDPS